MLMSPFHNTASMVFEIPSSATTLAKNIQECEDFLRKHGVNDTTLLCDHCRNAHYAAKRAGVKSRLTIGVDILIDNAIQVTVTDSSNPYQLVEIRRNEEHR